jgi:hypothetical protein
MFDSGFIIPYVDADGETLLFTTNEKREAFKEKFPSMRECDLSSQHYPKMLAYII